MTEQDALLEPVPDDLRWDMLDDATWAAWDRMHLLAGKPRVLRWGQLPPHPEQVTALRLVTQSPTNGVLPQGLDSLLTLRWLFMDKHFVKGLSAAQLPASLRALILTGDGTLAWPKGLVLEHLVKLGALSAVRFRPENLPALRELGVSLDRKGLILPIIASYPDLLSLGMGPVDSTEPLGRLTGLPLQRLSISGGAIESLAGIAELTSLNDIALASLPKLGSIAGLEHLPLLRAVTLSRCTALTEVDALAEASTLERVDIIDCPRVDADRTRQRLQHLRPEALRLV